MLVLHDYILSARCYAVRLLLGFLDCEFTVRPVDVYPGQEHASPAFLAMNPFGQVPVLEDGGLLIRNTRAILLSLAATRDPDGQWWPCDDPGDQARTIDWLILADGLEAVAAVRRHAIFGESPVVDTTRAHDLFRHLENHLAQREFVGAGWLAAPHPTIADIAWFPATALAGDGGIDTDCYPAIRRWLRRMKHLPGFQPMPGIT